MKNLLRTLLVVLAAGSVGAAFAQEERVIKFGHLNNADHPVSLGVKRFAELLAAKSGGKCFWDTLTPAEQARMAQVAKAVTDRLASNDNPAVVKLYNDELARIKK